MSPPKIVQVETSKLIPYARNARTHSDEQVLQISRSIDRFGFNNPVLIDSEDGIIAGHGRVMAANALGLAKVPCIRLSHLTDDQKRAYILADNKIAENSGWDESLLAVELAFLDEMKFDTSLMGFSSEDLDRLISSVGDDAGDATGEKEPESVPESNYSEQYGVIVVCESEAAQETTFNALQAQGYNCKVVTT